ncbi:hypothetical protein GCM10011492_37210 [Flexivirga endophytica]|uniref:DUF3024 domain-containing protein n=1 Tax=Flexivirga endophytica TaxID=1849103 RepID=A0A916WY34_9MICO|nr:DUF3024 domain-containing protein [Flexivirga endophytica]GGB42832.1 hypothetical protein GCM10011492_37210 [Flexivirga endophytica]GHB64349.1 hypothetical protein GCM10008112_36560 [Flexivirga endophytica]
MAWRRKIPETDFARLQRWCESKVPPRDRREVRIECHIRGTFVTLSEARPNWSGDGGWTHRKVWQLRYYEEEQQWGLYWYAPRTGRWGRYARGFQFHCGSMVEMLAEIDLYPDRLLCPDRF